MKKTAIALAISMVSGSAFATGLSTNTNGGSTEGWKSTFRANGSHSLNSRIWGQDRAASAFSGASVGGNIVAVTPGASSMKAAASSSTDLYGFAVDGALGVDFCILDLEVQGIGADVSSDSDASGSASIDLAKSHRGEVEFGAAATSGLDLRTVDMKQELTESYKDFEVVETYDAYETSYKTVETGIEIIPCLVCK